MDDRAVRVPGRVQHFEIRLLQSRRIEHAIPGPFENRAREKPDRFIVFDDEHGFRPTTVAVALTMGVSSLSL
jgi:hypothetical protein